MEHKLNYMAEIIISDKTAKERNLLYVQNHLECLSGHLGFSFQFKTEEERCFLSVVCPDYYSDIVSIEINDRIAEIIAINYKYDFFKKRIKICGLNETEYEILMTSIISADLEDDKKYVFNKLKDSKNNVYLDGFFNFRLQVLKKKWEEIVSYIPHYFVNAQLKEFISYLLESKKKKVYIDNGKVFDYNYKRLKRCELLDGDFVNIVREVILSNCGEVELNGDIPKEDETYLKEYYGDKIIFSQRYFV